MNGILSLTGKELRLTTRTGLPLFTMQDETALNEMNCVLYLDETSLLAGCGTNQITSVDLTTAQVTGQVGEIKVLMLVYMCYALEYSGGCVDVS